MELITKKEHGCSLQFVDILMKVMGMLPYMPCMPFNGCPYTVLYSPPHILSGSKQIWVYSKWNLVGILDW